MIASRRSASALALLLLAAAPGSAVRAQATAAAPVAAVAAPAAASRLPERLADSTFWRMVTEFSEPDGYFRSDNLVSNETTFQHVIPTLVQTIGAGAAYVGVGPDQNFTYMVALRPRVAFIVDIRRGALLQHLLYKALFEEAEDRAAFLSLLFGRPRPAGLAADAPPEALMAAFADAAPDSALHARARALVRARLVERHGFTLSEDDLRGIAYVQDAFHDAGPELTYSYPNLYGSFGPRRMPTYGELMAEHDGQGVQRGYLASEANYQVLRDLQRRNLVVPVVGNFAGDKALRAVGGWLRSHDATVGMFYLSNVEQYLFRQADDWRRFFANAGALPTDSASTFVRSVFDNMSYRDPLASRGPTVRSTSVRSPIAETVRAVGEGRIATYFDLVQMSKP